jgi:Fels-1 Prophage Protein-like
MHLSIARLVLCSGLVCSACGAPQLSIYSRGAEDWTDSRWSPLYRPEQDVWWALPGYGRSPLGRPYVACDRLGRCWQLGPYDRYALGHARPPSWAGNLPGSAWMGNRFVRPRLDVVCDQATRICYKRGKIDKSDTEDVLGERAGDRADDLRDQLNTARVFVPERGVACDRERRICLEDGNPDRSLTRRYFGKRAARALDDEQSGDGGARPAN